MRPRTFYVEKVKVKWKNTSLFTGLMRTPIDMLYRNDCWIEPDNASTDELHEKRTLIIADHAHLNRSDNENDEIIEALRKAADEGFEILLLQPNGQIEIWDAYPLPYDYYLSPIKFSTAHIAHLANHQHQLSFKKIKVINYFGINELLDRNPYQINWDHFKKDPSQFFEIYLSSQNHEYEIKFLTVDDLKQFLKLAAQKPPEAAADYLNKLISVSIEELSSNEYVSHKLWDLIAIAKNLQSISVEMSASTRRLMWSATNFLPGSLPNLKKIKLNGTFNWSTVINILQASQNLQEFEIYSIEGISIESKILLPNSLKYLETLKARCDPGMSKRNLLSLFAAAPNLRKVSFPSSHLVNRLSDLKPNSLPYLESFDFDSSKYHENDMLAFINATTNLKEFDFDKYKVVLGDNILLDKFSHLTHITGAIEELPNEIFSSAKNLQSLKISIEKLTPNVISKIAQCSNSLTKLDLTLSNDESNWPQLLNNLPMLQTIKIDGGFLNKTCQNLKVGCLSKVKEITLANNNFSSSAGLRALFLAIPNVETMWIGNHPEKDLKDLLANISDLSAVCLPNLKNIYFTNMSAGSLKSLFRIAPNLCSLNIEDLHKLGWGMSDVPTLFALTSLKLYNCHFSQDDFCVLLHCISPNLTLLEIGNYNDIKEKIARFIMTKFSKLEDLRINNCGISLIDLATILAASSKLKALNLYRSNLLEEDFVGSDQIHLKNVRNFYCKESKLNGIVLQTLLSKMTRLERFEAPYLMIKNDSLDLPPNSLPHLRLINLNNTEITAHSIENLLLAAPYVTEVNIYNCKNIENSLSRLTPNSLPYLKKIDLGDDHSLAEIENLMQAAPSLKSLKINTPSSYATQLLSLSPSSLSKLRRISKIPIEKIVQEAKNFQEISNKLSNNDSYNETVDIKNRHPEIKNDNSLNSNNINSTDKNLSSSQSSIRLKDADYTSIITQVQTVLPNLRVENKVKKTFNAIRHFPNVSSTLERHESFHVDLSLKNLIREPITDWKPATIGLKEYDDPLIYEPGFDVITPSKGLELRLPSLHADESIVELQIIDSRGKTLPSTEFEFDHSDKKNYYRVTLKKIGTYTVNFRVAYPDRKLSDNLQKIVDDYKQYHPIDEPEPDFPTLAGYAEYADKNQTGACQLRSIAATAHLTQCEEVFLIGNTSHALIEAKQAGKWHNLNLEGYDGILNESLPPTQQAATEVIEEKNVPLVAYTSEEVFTYITMKEMDKLLAIGDSDVAYFQLLDLLRQHHQYVCDIDELFKISLTGRGMTHAGSVKPDYTKLRIWLNQHKQGAIVIDIRNFDNIQITQLNELLDHRIGIFDLNNIQIILYDQPNRTYGFDLIGRVVTLILPISNDKMLLPPINTSIKNTLVIDLYESLFWERQLLGAWQLNKTAKEGVFKFSWKDGPLIKLIEKPPAEGMQVILKNPPLKEQKFLPTLAVMLGLKRAAYADKELPLPKNILITTDTGYEWNKLIYNASVELLDTQAPIYILSDANLLSFIERPRYEFSPDTNTPDTNSLISFEESYLDLAKKSHKSIHILCTPGTSAGAIAELLTIASNQGVKIKFVTRSFAILEPPLNRLKQDKNLAESKEANKKSVVNVQLHQDVYYAVHILMQSQPKAMVIPACTLSSANLGWYNGSPELLRKQFLETEAMSVTATRSTIIKALLKGETVILTGAIPSSLYQALMSLSLGYFENKKITGKLILVAPLTETLIAEALTGPSPQIIPKPSFQDKLSLLKLILPPHVVPAVDKYFAQESSLDLQTFAEMESSFLQHQLIQVPTVFQGSDEQRAALFHQAREILLASASQLSRKIKVEGETGLGKTHLFQVTLANKGFTFDMNSWLNEEIKKIVVDEASFLNQQGNRGENFLERFKYLPHYYDEQDQYHYLPENSVYFLYNPTDYGSGRNTQGILTEHGVFVKLTKLPDYCLRADIINHMLVHAFANANLANLISEPLLEVYTWLLKHTKPKQVLMTPREIIITMNILISAIKSENINDPESLTRLSGKLAYDIGIQTLDDPKLIEAFTKEFKPTMVLRKKIPDTYLPHQHDAYVLLNTIVQTHKQFLTKENPDLGLGVITLEGDSGIGKSIFLDKYCREYEEKTGKKVVHILATDSMDEKIRLLIKAHDEETLVYANEMNTILWPNPLFTQLLNGRDEFGNKTNKKSLLILTSQNPSSFERFEEDLAIRRRSVKIKCTDWPVLRPKKDLTKINISQPTFPNDEKISSPSNSQLTNEEKNSTPTKYSGHGQHPMFTTPETKSIPQVLSNSKKPKPNTP